MVLLLALVMSLLLGFTVSSALRDALLQSWSMGSVRAAAQALEQAEATLVEGAGRLTLIPPAACSPCLPPGDPHRLLGNESPWQAGEQGYFLLQQLGATTQAAHLPNGTSVTLFRVTAVSRQVAARKALEAIYAVGGEQAGPPQRVAWRQRSRER